MADPRRVLSEIARENSDYRITAKFVDQLGVGIPAANLAEAKLTLHLDDGAATLINSVNAVDIKNTGRGTIDANGNLVIALLPADNPILDSQLLEEVHIARVDWKWNGGASSSWQQLEYRVRNAARVP